MAPNPIDQDVENFLKHILHNYSKLEFFDKINDKVKECKDPLLKSIASQFVENYGRALKVNGNNSDEYKENYCKYIQEWLDYMKYFYTLGGTCESKKKLWIKHIHEPFAQIEKKFNDNTWCNLHTDGFNYSFLPELTPYNCDDHNVIPSIIPVSVGFALFGIALLVIFLYKFTPMEWWIRFHNKKKRKSLQDIYQEEKQELSENILWNSCENTQNNMNQLSYHPRRN
ncbi:PIR Superfamily Protein [Plasmodium ovale curtisi]|uniref:PIR Superfamily Protein n=1 Tax=Plasmodium ovale curtisi TaxID=864141 RepID=A0A1A8WHW5_PLAOA|nr:PIR Superfamily Protein [Plasmodium ovale curtisi]